MDKKIKLFAVLAITFILLATPASAYQIKLHGPASENHIQVSYSWYESAALSNFEAPYAAQKVMNMAKNNHMTINRNTTSIMLEIQAHAYAYLMSEAFWGNSRSNPVDIILSEDNRDWKNIY